MKTVFVVYEFYDSPYGNDNSKRVDRIFLSKTKAEEFARIENKCRVRGYYYEIEEESFDDSL